MCHLSILCPCNLQVATVASNRSTVNTGMNDNTGRVLKRYRNDPNNPNDRENLSHNGLIACNWLHHCHVVSSHAPYAWKARHGHVTVFSRSPLTALSKSFSNVLSSIIACRKWRHGVTLPCQRVQWRLWRQLNVQQFQVFIVATISGHVTARRHQSSQRGVERDAYFRHAQSLVGLSTPASGHDAANFRRTAARRKQRVTGLHALNDLHPRTHNTSNRKSATTGSQQATSLQHSFCISTQTQHRNHHHIISYRRP